MKGEGGHLTDTAASSSSFCLWTCRTRLNTDGLKERETGQTEIHTSHRQQERLQERQLTWTQPRQRCSPCLQPHPLLGGTVLGRALGLIASPWLRSPRTDGATAEVRGCGTRLLLCRLKRSELSSSTGVTSFILRLSFPSPCSAALSPPSPGTMALAAIATSADTSPAASDFSAKGEISVEHVVQKNKFRKNEGSF